MVYNALSGSENATLKVEQVAVGEAPDAQLRFRQRRQSDYLFGTVHPTSG